MATLYNSPDDSDPTMRARMSQVPSAGELLSPLEQGTGCAQNKMLLTYLFAYLQPTKPVF